MFFAHVKGLGFIRFLSVDGGVSQQVFFTHDPEQATKWETKNELVKAINGDIASGDFQILRIEWI
jgi:hypothetical protein